MARFKLGAIITDLQGSIGGTVFRRGITSGIIYNKGISASKNKLLQNAQLNPISAIFRKWSLFTPEQQDDWNSASLLFLFPDKFGTLRNITGRQLFTKLNIQLLPNNTEILNPDGINSDTQPFTVFASSVTSDKTSALIQINGSTPGQTYFIQAEVSLRDLRNPTFTRSQIFQAEFVENTEIIDLTDNFYSKFPYFNAQYTVIFYVTAVNEYGFKSVTLWSIATLDP